MDHDKIDPFTGFLNDFSHQQLLLKETLIHRNQVLRIALEMIDILEEVCPSLEAAHTLHHLKQKLTYGQSLDFYMDMRMAALKEIAQKAQDAWKQTSA